ncbi:calmodulin-4-like [Haliotis rubra]|uniref:calmodulin-4-like n=1 Tax=Haliotis rubra TaxID=36100 RepID=UPI001EE520AA|nr:calmodulin-4-like [Haliotis rubra]
MNTADEVAVYTKAFHDFDANHDGHMTLSEFSCACAALGFTYDDETIQSLFTEMDADKNGKVTLEEFLDFMGPDNQEKLVANIRRLFNEYDTNKDGFLSADEIQSAWFSGEHGTKKLSKEEVAELMAPVDANSDGKLNREEFLQLVMSAMENNEGD